MSIGKAIALFAVMVSTAACISDIGDIRVSIVRSEDPDRDPFNNIATQVRIYVTGPCGRSDTVESPVSSNMGRLPEVAVCDDAPGQQVVVDGVLLAGDTVARSRARSQPIRFGKGTTDLSLFMAPTTTSSLVANRMSEARAFHSATLLSDGSVVFAGGIPPVPPMTDVWRPTSTLPIPVPLASAERIDGDSLTFSAMPCTTDPCLQKARFGHASVALRSGDALLLGGIDENGAAMASTELYATQESTFLAGPDLSVPRAWTAADSDRQGDPVVVGGLSTNLEPTGEAERFADSIFSPLPQLGVPRSALTLTSAPTATGERLIAIGGIRLDGGYSADIDVFSGGGGWSTVAQLAQARAYHTTTRLDDGTLLIIGGLDGQGQAIKLIERYDPETNQVSAAGELITSRWAHTATQLVDGRVIVAGGYSLASFGSVTGTVEEIRIISKDDLLVGQLFFLTFPRAGHTATLLRSGMLLFAGGVSENVKGPFVTNTAEVFVY